MVRSSRRASEQRVFAEVGDVETVASTHAELRGVVVHGDLLIADGGLVLDDNAVVRVLTLVSLAVGSLLARHGGLVEEVVAAQQSSTTEDLEISLDLNWRCELRL